jgi:ubiquinone/menaquinone biosynthesis C-methylase UbiE
MGTPAHESIASAWDKVAPGYDEFVTPTYFGLGARALSRAGVHSGTRVLDVAAGSGALSLAAARLGADVTAVDISPVMVERLKARAREEGLKVEARVMDGQALDLHRDSFDLVASEFGVMLFPDLPQGLREMTRVAKPGGRVVVIAFASPMQVEFLRFFVAAVQAVVPGFTGPPTHPPPLPFQLQDPETFRGEMIKAGLKDVRVEETSEEMKYASGQYYWNWVINSNPLAGGMLADLNLQPDQIAQIQRAADDLIRQRAGRTGTAILISPINIGIGTK